MNQSVIDTAVNMATRAAMNGNPVERLIWIPPQLATHDPRGAWVVIQAREYTASETPPWGN